MTSHWSRSIANVPQTGQSSTPKKRHPIGRDGSAFRPLDSTWIFQNVPPEVFGEGDCGKMRGGIGVSKIYKDTNLKIFEAECFVFCFCHLNDVYEMSIHFSLEKPRCREHHQMPVLRYGYRDPRGRSIVIRGHQTYQTYPAVAQSTQQK